MFHVKHLHEGVILAAIDALRAELTELDNLRINRPWAIPALVAAIQKPVCGEIFHRNPQHAAHTAAEATLRLAPLNTGNRALAGLLAVLVLNFSGEEMTLEETIGQGILPDVEQYD